jgi:hypothetical protein
MKTPRLIEVWPSWKAGQASSRPPNCFAAWLIERCGKPENEQRLPTPFPVATSWTAAKGSNWPATSCGPSLTTFSPAAGSGMRRAGKAHEPLQDHAGSPVRSRRETNTDSRPLFPSSLHAGGFDDPNSNIAEVLCDIETPPLLAPELDSAVVVTVKVQVIGQPPFALASHAELV